MNYSKGEKLRTGPKRGRNLSERCKRAALWLLCAAMLLVGIPQTAFAGEPGATVSVSVFLKGDPAETGEGKLALQLPVQVEEGDTLDQTMAQLHERYCTDPEGYQSESGMVYTFWGVETVSLGFYRNDKMTNAVDQETVSDGDDIVVFQYIDEKGWTDAYACFDQKQVLLSAGDSVNLHLQTETGAFAGAEIFLSDGETLKDTGVRSLEDGSVSLEGGVFASEGTYYIIAKSDPDVLVPAVCRVDVEGSYTPDEMQAFVDADQEALTIPGETNEDLNLPLTGESGKTTITWNSSDPSVITEEGVIRRGAVERSAELTAVIQCGEKRAEKKFTVTVLSMAQEEIQSMLQEVAALLEKDVISVQEWENAAFGENNGEKKQDENIVSVAEALLRDYPEVKVFLKESRVPQIKKDGTIVYEDTAYESGEGGVTLTLGVEDLAEASRKDAKIQIRIPAHEKTKEEVLSEVAESLTFGAIRKENTTASAVTTDLALPSDSDLSFAVKIEWTADPQDIIASNGKITRPVYGQPDALVTLTATISIDPFYADYGMAPPGPQAEPKTVQLTVTVSAIGEDEYEDIKKEVDAALETITPDSLYYIGESGAGAQPADLAHLTWDLQLVSAGNGIDAQWSSDQNEVLQVNYRRGKVVRPGPGEPDAPANLTVTLSKGGYSTSKVFPVTVMAVTREEIREETEAMDLVEACLFEGIRQENTTASAIQSDLRVTYRGIVEKDTITWRYTNQGELGIEISDWTSDNPQVMDKYGKITKPEKDTEVTLSATLSSIRLEGHVPDRQVSISMTVLSDQQKKIQALLSAIASGFTGTRDGWEAMDMGAYLLYDPDTSCFMTKEAVQNYVDLAINEIANVTTESNAGTAAKHILALRALGYGVTDLLTVNKTRVNAIEILQKMEPEKIPPASAAYVLIALQQEPETLSQDLIQRYIDVLKGQFNEETSLVDWGGTWTDPDTTAFNLTAMAPYYGMEGDPYDVDERIESSLKALSELQRERGSFGSSNSDAMVICALAALGVDIQDPDFVKNGFSVLDGLLSYAVAGDIGFGFDSGETKNDMATEQGFRALIAALQAEKTDGAFSVYDFTQNPRQQATASGTGSGGSKPSDPAADETITVYFTLKGDTLHGDTSHTGSYPVWIPKVSVTVPEDATVYHVFTKILDEKGYTYEGAEKGYVTSITTPEGTTLSQLDNGPLSGWLYTVNGTSPSASLTACSLSQGDQIVWYYTDDYTKEESSSQWQGSPGTGLPGQMPETDPEMPQEEVQTLLQKFVDVAEDDWYAGAVAFVVKENLFAGTSDTTFEPGTAMTRAMFAAVLSRMDGADLSACTNSPFSDVSVDAWYGPAMQWAKETGILSGYGNGVAGPENSITREQMAVMLYLYGEIKGIASYTQSSGILAGIRDQDEISSWALQAVTWAVETGILCGKGDGILDPKGTATRGEAACMLERFDKILSGMEAEGEEIL